MPISQEHSRTGTFALSSPHSIFQNVDVRSLFAIRERENIRFIFASPILHYTLVNPAHLSTRPAERTHGEVGHHTEDAYREQRAKGMG